MILAAVLLTSTLAVTELTAQTQQWTLPGLPRGLYALDVTGDGVLDGVVVLIQHGQRQVVILDAASTARLPAAPPRPVAVPEDAVLLGACPGIGPGLLFVRPGVLERRAPDGSLSTVAQLQGALPFVEHADLAVIELCPDGKPPVLLPSLAGVLAVDAPGEVRSLSVPTRTHMASGLVFRGPRARRDFSLMTVLVHPRAFAGDLDGDGQRDLGFAIEEDLALYVGGAPVRTLRLPVRSPAELASDEGIVDTRLVDLTGDRVLDAVVTFQRGGSDTMRTSWKVFAGPLIGRTPGTTLASIDRKGLAAPLLVHDVDLDGILDVVEPQVDTGILAMGKALVTGRILVSYRVHRFAGGRHVEGAPLDLDAEVDFGRSTQMAGHPPLFGLDLNDDGRGDLVDLSASTMLSIHLGQKSDPPFAKASALDVQVPSSDSAVSLRSGRQGPPLVLLLDERDGSARLTLVRITRSGDDGRGTRGRR
ncbi:MAG: hypothetical protein ABIJ09_08250 [Pseudomonadota bacterium]